MNYQRNTKIALLVLLLWSCSAPLRAQMTKVAIGYSGISADQLVIWVAKDTRRVLKTSATVSQMNGAVITTELTE